MLKVDIRVMVVMRMRLWIVLGAGIISMLTALCTADEQARERKGKKVAQGNGFLVFIGTYTRPGKSEGIYVYRMDPGTGALTYVSKATGIKNPSFLDLHPNRRFLYAVSEIADFAGKPTGGVTAYAISPETGELRHLNDQTSKGAGPCHLSVDGTGKYVLVANYGGGSVAAVPIQSDGRLGEASDFIQHKGSSVNPRRQEAPHAHSIILDPANRFAFAADLGLDKILIYEVDFANGKLKAKEPASVKAGEGPRHFDFHPNGKYAYVINEIGNTITGFAYDAKTGKLTEIQMISTLPADFTTTTHTADIHVHPSGKFLYGSNRGHDSIAVFQIDETTGRLTLVEHEPTQGKTPRNFGIDPTGKFLLAANQETDNIVVFKIDHQTGRLAATGQVAQVPTPVCIKFMRK